MLISLQNIHKSYSKGETKISPLQGVDLEIAEGQFVALMGPSGSGKSTLLNLIAGIDRATEGKTIIGDEDITLWSERAWRNGARARSASYSSSSTSCPCSRPGRTWNCRSCSCP